MNDVAKLEERCGMRLVTYARNGIACVDILNEAQASVTPSSDLKRELPLSCIGAHIAEFTRAAIAVSIRPRGIRFLIWERVCHGRTAERKNGHDCGRRPGERAGNFKPIFAGGAGSASAIASGAQSVTEAFFDNLILIVRIAIQKSLFRGLTFGAVKR